MGISQPTTSRIVAALEKQIGVALLVRTTRAVTRSPRRAPTIYLVSSPSCPRSKKPITPRAGMVSYAASCASLRPPPSQELVSCHGWRVSPICTPAYVSNSSSMMIGKTSWASRSTSRCASAFSTIPRRSPARLERPIASSLQRPPIWPGPERHRFRPTWPTTRSSSAPLGRGLEGWTFRRGGKANTVRVEGRYILNGSDAAAAAALAGLGILSTGDLSVMSELESGQLVRVLPDGEMGSADINIVLPAGRARRSRPPAPSRISWRPSFGSCRPLRTEANASPIKGGVKA
ncbi:DNA-binding transcriptional LysR family regulator [Bradyrhizobium sp. i1.3.6]